MGGDEGRAGLQAAMDFRDRAPPFLRGQEMQGQQAGGRIERPLRRIVDIPFVQAHARRQRPKPRPRELQHLRRRVDAVEAPAGMRLGKDLQFQAAAGTEHQHPRGRWRLLGEQDRGHALHVGEAGHEARRPLRIARHRCRIGKMRQQFDSVRAHAWASRSWTPLPWRARRR